MVEREETPSRLYLPVGAGERSTHRQPEQLATGLGKPLDLAVSPDGASLVFAGQRDQAYGLWLVNPSTGGVRRLAGGKYMSASFSPDGTQVAAVFQQNSDRSQLQVLQLP
jgi:Tol biopolymer transport system component